jgi:D-glycero-alpha-D-manno-heptose-7-phosphate kinase
MIGRQDQYALVYGGFNCFEFDAKGARPYISDILQHQLIAFKERLLLLHTGISRNAQAIVEEVYNNYQTPQGQEAIDKLAQYGVSFAKELKQENYDACGKIMHDNFMMQKQLAPSSSSPGIDEIYDFALENGAKGGKICGAGGGGAFVFYSDNPADLLQKIKTRFTNCFEIDFDFSYKNIKALNKI